MQITVGTKVIDPFKNTPIGGSYFSGGTWKYMMKYGAKHLGKAEFYSEILNLYTGKTTNTLVVRLDDLPSISLGNPFEAGQSGSGENFLAGGTIPVGRIFWKVTKVT